MNLLFNIASIGKDRRPGAISDTTVIHRIKFVKLPLLESAQLQRPKKKN